MSIVRNNKYVIAKGAGPGVWECFIDAPDYESALEAFNALYSCSVLQVDGCTCGILYADAEIDGKWIRVFPKEIEGLDFKEI